MIIQKSRKPILGAENNSGTTYYTATLDDLFDAFEDSDYVWIYYSLAVNGFDALDLALMDGSRVIDDVLYICVTNYKDINVEGEDVDPEKALDKYSRNIDVLGGYIQEADKQIIQKSISIYELNMQLLQRTINQVAIEALSDGVDFKLLAEDFGDLKF